jgi:aspartate-semialdehyde dehydrogenase
MSNKLVGLVGWRGMVGSVLMDRMQAEGDFGLIEPIFFSTSNAGGQAPAQAKAHTTLQDANDIAALAKCDIVITCQGGGCFVQVERAGGKHECRLYRMVAWAKLTRGRKKGSP